MFKHRRRHHEGLAGEALQFDQREMGFQCGVQLLPARCGGLGLQLRPFEVADGATAVGALGGLFGTQQALSLIHI